MDNMHRRGEEGKIGWVLLWLLGVPIPLLLIFFLLRGCTLHECCLRFQFGLWFFHAVAQNGARQELSPCGILPNICKSVTSQPIQGNAPHRSQN